MEEIETYRNVLGKRIIQQVKENILEKNSYNQLCETYVNCLGYPWSFNYAGRNYWELTEEEKGMFLGKNAKEFYGFKNLIELPYIKNMSE